MNNLYIFNVLCIWILLIIVETFRNYFIIDNGSKPNYLHSFILRATVSLFHAVLLLPDHWVKYAPVLTFQVCSFIVVFNPLLSTMRKKPDPFRYLGRESGWIDGFFVDDKGLYTIFYIGCVIVSAVSIYIIYLMY